MGNLKKKLDLHHNMPAKQTKAAKKALATKLHTKLHDAAARGTKLTLTKQEQAAYLSFYLPQTMAENSRLQNHSNLQLYSNDDLLQRTVAQLKIPSLNGYTVTVKPLNATGATVCVSVILLGKVGVNYKDDVHDFHQCFTTDGLLKKDTQQFTTSRQVELWIAAVKELLTAGLCIQLTLCENYSGKCLIFV